MVFWYYVVRIWWVGFIVCTQIDLFTRADDFTHQSLYVVLNNVQCPPQWDKSAVTTTIRDSLQLGSSPLYKCIMSSKAFISPNCTAGLLEVGAQWVAIMRDRDQSSINLTGGGGQISTENNNEDDTSSRSCTRRFEDHTVVKIHFSFQNDFYLQCKVRGNWYGSNTHTRCHVSSWKRRQNGMAL